MKKKTLKIQGRNGQHHILEQDSSGKYKLKSKYFGISYDPVTKQIVAIDPDDGPYMTVGFIFYYKNQGYRIISFSRLDEPLLIGIEEIN